MKARLEFTHRDSGQRRFRMMLTDDWPEGWTVPYADLLTANLIQYFETPPPDPEGISAGTSYQMSASFVNEDYAAFCKSLTTLIGQIKPPSPIETGVEYTYVADYD